jgi:hypothetical protein
MPAISYHQPNVSVEITANSPCGAAESVTIAVKSSPSCRKVIP